MKTIALTKGKFTTVDDEDYEMLSKYKWRYHPKNYATTDIKGKSERMHRIIMNAPKGMDTDHIDGDGLNNQKVNLRICSRSQNMMNTVPRRDSSTGFKGVSFYKAYKFKKYESYINKDGKRYKLGYYKTKEEAALAYNKAAIELFGEFAKINCLPGDTLCSGESTD
jgi:hypothetical protein